jgi:uncharacterized membrane protein YbhN (UPF0104 family)
MLSLKRLWKYSGVAVAIVLLTLVVWTLDARQIGASLISARPELVLSGLALVQLQIMLSALRWRFTAGRLGQPIGTIAAIGDYYLGTLVNQLLPGGVAGDALRALRHRADAAGGWKVPAQAVLFERLAGQGMFFLIAGLGLLLWPWVASGDMPKGLSAALRIATVVLPACLILVALLLLFPPLRLKAWLAGLKTALWQVFVHRGAWTVQLSLSFVIVGSYMAMFMLASAAIGAPLPAIASITIIPICLLMMLFPATVAGWGAREAAAAALWPAFGYDASQGVAASILYGIMALVGAVPGLFIGAAMLLRPHGRRRFSRSADKSADASAPKE